MRLGPDEAGVDEADLCEALELAQADGEELARLELGAGPGGRGRQPALAAAAERDGRLLGNAVGDVDAARWARDQGGAGSAGRLSHVEREGGRGDARVAQAVDAEVGAVRLDRRAAVCCAGKESQLWAERQMKRPRRGKEEGGRTCAEDVGSLSRGTDVGDTSAHGCGGGRAVAVRDEMSERAQAGPREGGDALCLKVDGQAGPERCCRVLERVVEPGLV